MKNHRSMERVYYFLQPWASAQEMLLSSISCEVFFLIVYYFPAQAFSAHLLWCGALSKGNIFSRSIPGVSIFPPILTSGKIRDANGEHSAGLVFRCLDS
jgi:hypothetical protein